MQHLQQQMQAQQLRQQQAAAGQRQPQQLMGNGGSFGASPQGLQQMQQAQFGNQHWSDSSRQQAVVGSQRGGQRNSFTGGMPSATALSLLQQQSQGGNQMGAMGGASNAQAALYWNALQASSNSGPGGNTAGGATNSSMPGVGGIQVAQFHGSSSSSMGVSGQSDSQALTQASNSSAQLLMHQQKMMADLKRQLQSPHGSGTMNASVSSGSSGSLATPGLDRRTSGSTIAALQGHQRHTLFQLQQQGMSSLQEQSRGVGGSASLQQDRRSSFGSTDPMTMAHLLGGQGHAVRRSSSGSQTMNSGMGSMFGSADGGADGSSLLMRQQAQLQQQAQMQQLANNGGSDQLLAQQRLLNSTGMLPIGQDAPMSHTVSRSNSQLLGQPGDAHVQQMVSEVGFQSSASDGGSRRSSASEPSEKAQGKSQSSSKSKTSTGSQQGVGGDPSASGCQSFLNGTFEGGWQSNADLPERRGVIISIVKVIEQMRPDASNISQK